MKSIASEKSKRARPNTSLFERITQNPHDMGLPCDCDLFLVTMHVAKDVREREIADVVCPPYALE